MQNEKCKVKKADKAGNTENTRFTIPAVAIRLRFLVRQSLGDGGSFGGQGLWRAGRRKERREQKAAVGAAREPPSLPNGTRPDRGAVGLRRRAIHESPLHARRCGARFCVGAHGLCTRRGRTPLHTAPLRIEHGRFTNRPYMRAAAGRVSV